jgi:hypothetical protein
MMLNNTSLSLAAAAAAAAATFCCRTPMQARLVQPVSHHG